MGSNDTVAEVRSVLQQFQDGYTARDLSTLDEFLKLFARAGSIELIGTGASMRGGYEWVQGLEAIRETIESDWRYWGDVKLNVQDAMISVLGKVAWLSTTGELVQTVSFDKALGFYVQHLKELLDDPDEELEARLMEATHFGMRRLREKFRGAGYGWPLVFTAVLVNVGDKWRFHTIHWSMPVD